MYDRAAAPVAVATGVAYSLAPTRIRVVRDFGITGEYSEAFAQEEIAQALEVTVDTVDGRMRMMRDQFRRRMAKLGMLPDMLPLAVIVSHPSAIHTLREAA
jgi:hypothetical protein